jgi:hypothetical protein
MTISPLVVPADFTLRAAVNSASSPGGISLTDDVTVTAWDEGVMLSIWMGVEEEFFTVISVDVSESGYVEK